MRRIRIIGLTLLAATALPGAVAARAQRHVATAPRTSARIGAAASGRAPRAVLRDVVCQRALDPAARVVDVAAVMRPLTGTERMAVQFVLFQKLPGALVFTSVAATGWVSPADPTLGQRARDVWIIKHPVADLNAPAAYRFQVSFRWTGAKGRILGTSVRSSRVCVQPELRPDLVVQGVSAAADPNHPKALDDYTVTLANTGATGAGPFTLQLADGSVVKSRTVEHLGPGEVKTFQFVGPTCDASAPPVVTVDPMDQVDVSTRSGASLTVVCPAPSAPGSGAPSGSAAAG